MSTDSANLDRLHDIVLPQADQCALFDEFADAGVEWSSLRIADHGQLRLL